MVMACSLEKKLKTDLLEKLADLEHRQWAIFLQYLCKHGYITKRPQVLNWLKQARTPYKELSGEDKEKDRRFARCVTQLLREELGKVAQKIRDIFEGELEEQEIQSVDSDVLFAWNVIKKKVLGLIVEEGGALRTKEGEK